MYVDKFTRPYAIQASIAAAAVVASPYVGPIAAGQMAGFAGGLASGRDPVSSAGYGGMAAAVGVAVYGGINLYAPGHQVAAGFAAGAAGGATRAAVSGAGRGAWLSAIIGGSVGAAGAHHFSSAADGLEPSSALPTAAASENRPELEAIANDPRIRPEIDKAWAESNPYGSGTAKQERGFWILRDSDTQALTVQQFPSNGTRDSLMPGPMPDRSVSFFHTHPNTSAEGYLQEPSPADVRFANSRGIPGIIRSHDGMYYFGPQLP